MANLPSPDVLRHVVDVHCHPTDSWPISAESMERLSITVCAMSTRHSDQPLVRNLATTYPSKIVPCFGYHPWFSHLIATNPTLSKEEHYKHLFLDSQKTVTPEHRAAFEKLLPLLPRPRPLNDVLDELHMNLNDFPNAMLGEVGLDRSFHVPYDYDTNPRELTPFNVPLNHQLVILEAQMNIAIGLGRHISVHSVKSQQATVDLLAALEKEHSHKFYRSSIDMHSCGLSPETWRVLEKKYPNVFLSLSTVINGKHSGYKALIASCSDDRIMVESDYHDINQSTSQTWNMLQIIAEVKKWKVETTWPDVVDENDWGAVRRLEQNWLKFQRGNHTHPSKPRSKHKERIDRYNSPSPTSLQ